MKHTGSAQLPTKAGTRSSCVQRLSLDCCPSYFNLICLPLSIGPQGNAVSQATTLCLFCLPLPWPGMRVAWHGPAPASPDPCLSAGHLRLANGAHQCEGRVELFLGQQWGTVCDDAWDLRAATVLCRQLGCGQALAAPGEARFGPGRGPILLDNVKCRGDESALLLCSHIRWDAHNCDHSEDASVLCQPL